MVTYKVSRLWTTVYDKRTEVCVKRDAPSCVGENADIITKRRHMARLSPETPVHRALVTHVNLSLGRLPSVS